MAERGRLPGFGENVVPRSTRYARSTESSQMVPRPRLTAVLAWTAVLFGGGYDGCVSLGPGSLWDVFADAMLAAGHAREGRSRYGDKPALFSGRREIAHLEPDGAIDLRVTRAGWERARQCFAADPAVRRDPARRDWIELRPQGASDLDRLSPLLAIAAEANA
jgi:Family of unknown function (DUF5519)